MRIFVSVNGIVLRRYSQGLRGMILTHAGEAKMSNAFLVEKFRVEPPAGCKVEDEVLVPRLLSKGVTSPLPESRVLESL